VNVTDHASVLVGSGRADRRVGKVVAAGGVAGVAGERVEPQAAAVAR